MNRSRFTPTQGITIVVLGLLIVSALGTVPTGVLAQTSESEPNDAQDAATVIEDSEVNGEIGDEGDVDWYEFRVEGLY
ncbi:hypothetical protein [Halococcus thailandensis]|uniref:Uncharacterized protein n=1 Tax=Halococcus thailandensis JCM 13552 TaxID=1227457 RepID=M0N0D7_9EURY|nr:hypothetical protein [Halococcus thailandensis]EMA50539.1 hypothetical protein C451_16270 [Halococcus thailandensis JCM 13552]